MTTVEGRMKSVSVLDSTLREGLQNPRINPTPEEMLQVAELLDSLNLSIIEVDALTHPKVSRRLFPELLRRVKRAKIAAFGMTCRPNLKAKDDPGLKFLIETKAPVKVIFGKTDVDHVKEVLKTNLRNNLRIITTSCSFLKKEPGTEMVIFDAEHFFDGWKKNHHYALECLEAALEGGADILCLCDTNGGTLPWEIEEIVKKTKKHFLNSKLGVHLHNDSGTATASTLLSIRAGVEHIQVTAHGFSERGLMADLFSVVPSLELKKMGCEAVGPEGLRRFTTVAKEICEIFHVPFPENSPYIGRVEHRAGTHKKGVRIRRELQEHVDFKLVGNKPTSSLNFMSGKEDVIYHYRRLGFEKIPKRVIIRALNRIKDLDLSGLDFTSAQASADLVLLSCLPSHLLPFEVKDFRLITSGKRLGNSPYFKCSSYAIVTVKIPGQHELEMQAAKAVGSLDALVKALLKALQTRGISNGHIDSTNLVDYEVKVLGADQRSRKKDTASLVRVATKFIRGDKSWTTASVSENVIGASLEAMAEGITYRLLLQPEKSK